ncbi:MULTISPECIES: vanadium-dependent haloperoxidase [unclassified Arenibacter]|uniref:vanadium-dependent haloperoxidase n=1 Tax=unclassified Arenibacter TaxID=2615047 RepID=UPI000E357820|nr:MULTISPECIES: vanadium-dependent haloperoxidase [unclassified Arenibacter]MCM4163188.1 phosphoesterase PA-phosphatase [Arenibacter sp. A80]RFT57213.1 phosphatase PAP2 family protein [Arenibacter sp. P308M17]
MKKMMFTMVVLTCLHATGCSNGQDTVPEVGTLSNKVILEWNDVAYRAFGGELYQNSVMASRINAMVHLAMHDALNAIYPKYATYAFTGKDAGADPTAAAAAAAYEVLVHEIPDQKVFLDTALTLTLSGIPEGKAKEKGLVLGQLAGQSILAIRANDGSSGNPITPIAGSNTPGVYQVVPPFDFVFAPFWADMKAFGLQKNDQFRSVTPPTLESEAYTADFNEVKSLGKKGSTVRTAEQTFYAQFWYEFSEAGWNRVAQTIAMDKKMDLWDTARLFALVDMAMADAYIAGWDSKFHYNLWRPYTAIRFADQDGNPNTIGDLEWDAEMPTPPVQDYPSTHSALGNAAATVIANIVGDNTSFTMASPTTVPTNSTRSFSSVKQAADENADSRVQAGIHFRFACEAGQKMGDKIGQWLIENYLQPLNAEEVANNKG